MKKKLICLVTVCLRGNRVLYLEDGIITGELSLPAYEGKDRAREELLSSWLEGLGW